MKLLLTTLSLDPERGSGTAQRTRYLSRHLMRAGVACAIATMEDGDLARELRQSGVPVYTTGHVRLPYHLPLLNPRRLSELVRWSDAVHILGYWNLLSIFVAALARWHKRPYLLCAAGEFATLQQRSAVKWSFHRLLGRKMIAGAHTIIAITDLEKRQIMDWLGVAAERILILPNGVEEVDAAATAEERSCPSSVLFMGRLATIKGPDLLLEAFGRVAAQFPDVRLTIAGPDGGLLDELKQRCAQLVLGSRVTFTGFLDEAARTAAYRDALLVVVPSRDEAMSLVALEAGAQAKALLVTDRCGLDEVARLGGGEIVDATVPALADALCRLLAGRDRLSAMGVRMRAYVSAHYAWPRVVHSLMQHLGEIPVGPPTSKGSAVTTESTRDGVLKSGRGLWTDQLSRERWASLVATFAIGLLYVWLRPQYPGSAMLLFGFLGVSVVLVAVTAMTRPSFFITTLALFLSLGFLSKFAVHLGFSADLIEPVGSFADSGTEWDMALNFATAGLLGTCAASAVAARIPAAPAQVPAAGSEASNRFDTRLLCALLFVELASALAVYALNYKFTIMRIGYPVGIALAKPLYGSLAFVIAWGAALGALFLTQRLVDVGRLSHSALIYVASLIGCLASITMGSRIQMLLFVFSATLAVVAQWRSVASWRAIGGALAVSATVFVLTLGIVSVDRNLAFHSDGQEQIGGPQASIHNNGQMQIGRPQPTIAYHEQSRPIMTERRLDGIEYELRTLIIMRWVGLEGVMTAAGARATLGWPLFAAAMREHPAAGTDSIYQHMSGDKYAGVTDYVFLSLPGPAGVASFSGSSLVVATFLFVLTLSGHLIERVAASATHNVASCALVGVSLAYLVVQLNVPRTLFVYVLELLAALAALALLRGALEYKRHR